MARFPSLRLVRRGAAASLAVAVVGGVAVLSTDDSLSQPSDPCAPQADYPLESVPCSLLVGHGIRAERADDADVQIQITEAEASAIALSLNPGAMLLETRLVYLSSPEDQGPARTLRWVVSLKLPDGIYVSGGAYYLAELKKIRPALDMRDRPLTPEEEDRIDAAVEAKIRADRAEFVDEYHIDYIDPVTGEWKGGAEGAR